jgi:casein kinase 1
MQCLSHLKYFHSRVPQGKNQILSQVQTTGAPAPAAQPDRRKDIQHRDSERRRASQVVGVVAPSPALVRNGSKQRKVPAALVPGAANVPGHITPLSAAAHVNVSVPTANQRNSQNLSPQHPYAAGGYEYSRDGHEDVYGGAQQYGRASPMVSSIGMAPPAVSNVRARPAEIGVTNNRSIGQDGDLPRPKNTLLNILTCRCG